MAAAVTEAVATASDPGKQMHLLAQVYLDFARNHSNLWWALFQFHLPATIPVPEWFAQEQARVLAQIMRPLGVLQPDLTPDQIIIRARTLFGAVHGIVSISLENRFVGVPGETLDTELTPAIAAVPSAMQARKTPKPDRPPRRSRKAKRRGSGQRQPGCCAVCDEDPETALIRRRPKDVRRS